MLYYQCDLCSEIVSFEQLLVIVAVDPPLQQTICHQCADVQAKSVGRSYDDPFV